MDFCPVTGRLTWAFIYVIINLQYKMTPVTIPFNAEIVYKMWDSETCIYIGHSHNFFRRMNKHWWQKVALGDRVEIYIYPSHEEALAVERLLIEQIKPRLNIRGVVPLSLDSNERRTLFGASRIGSANPNSRSRKIDRKRQKREEVK